MDRASLTEFWTPSAGGKIELGIRGHVSIVTSNPAKTYGELPIAKFVDCLNPTTQGTYGNVHVFTGSFDYLSALDTCPQVGYLLKQGNRSAKKLVKLAAISM